MHATVLVVDGRGFPDALVAGLERHGFSCLYARGPLKVRSHLAATRIDLVIWKDNAGNPALGQDLFHVWAEFPRLPILQLFTRGSRPASSLPAQVRGALPAEAALADLIAAVERILALRPPGGEANELAFRNVLTQLRGSADSGDLALADQPELIANPGTALNRSEREKLGVAFNEGAAHETEGRGSGAHRSPWRWLRTLFAAGGKSSPARV